VNEELTSKSPPFRVTANPTGIYRVECLHLADINLFLKSTYDYVPISAIDRYRLFKCYHTDLDSASNICEMLTAHDGEIWDFKPVIEKP
jgi:hypothetical protein